ncbi:MAG: hypothetical protein IKP77_04645 [Acholeplasmatales bacterium]|nr:hypothetical protein [Acholeplasmatales bacterium]
MKKMSLSIELLLFVFLIFILKFNNQLKPIIGDEDGDYTWVDLEFNTMDDVDDYIEWRFGSYPNFYYTTEHNYALLATQNIHQSTLRDDYNRLGNLMHDLNHDNIINDYDKIGLTSGICQPTAVTMAIRYMVSTGDIVYSPQLNNNIYDSMNVFYDVTNAYIQCGWTGGSAPREYCCYYLNTLFDNYNVNYYASYTTTNFVSVLSTAYNNCLPAIAHITSSNGVGHAMTIAGYYIKHIYYIDDSAPVEEEDYPEVDLDLCFVGVNNGMIDTLDDWANVNGVLPPSLYENNYSFFNVELLSGVTYICEAS